jgi:DNA-binding MarR family transcriptional regulator
VQASSSKTAPEREIVAALGMSEVAQDLGRLMKHLLGSNREFFQALEASGISLSQLKCLGLLSHADEPVSLGYVSEQLGISLPAVSRGVDGLVRRGEVKRTEDPSDRRSKLVTVTSKGRSTFGRLLEIRAAGVARFVDELEPGERDALGAALRPIVERLDL